MEEAAVKWAAAVKKALVEEAAAAKEVGGPALKGNAGPDRCRGGVLGVQ
jgi:hypothetical protein